MLRPAVRGSTDGACHVAALVSPEIEFPAPDSITVRAMPRIAILDDYQQVSQRLAPFDRLPLDCEITVFSEPLPDDDEAVIEALKSFTVICCMRERTAFDARRLERLPELRLIVTTGARNAAIDAAAARRLGVVFCGTRAPGHAASELTWGLILGLQRKLVDEDRAMRDGHWQTTLGRDCHGQTLGIVGLGRHGANVARFAQAFGMRCIAWSQNLTEARCHELGVERVERDALFRDADVISIHLVLGQRNRHLISQHELALMKSDAILINTSRGPIVDQEALIAALHAGSIGGAGLDVYEEEPLPTDHPLRRCPRTLLTSHVGFVTEQTYAVFYGDTLEAIEAWLAEAPVRVIVP